MPVSRKALAGLETTSTVIAFALTALTMLCFAANSILCRLALAQHAVDPASFTSVRLVSGAITLAALEALRRSRNGARIDFARWTSIQAWAAALALFAYAAAFSFAYVSLPASTGALILFGCVQATMIGVGVARGERLSLLQTFGAILAAGGLVYLLLPGLHAPSPIGAALMAAAGIAWGVYSLIGRAARGADPTSLTAGNFLRAAPIGLALLLPFLAALHLSVAGIALAVASGAVASGMGYAIWYAALKGLNASEAAIVQLTVPAIAALGAVLFLGEALSLRLAIAGAAILGGVFVVLTARKA